MGLLDKLKGKLDDLKEDLGMGASVEEKMPEIAGLLEDLDEIFADGLQWEDVGKVLGQVVPELMEIADSLEGKTGEEKREFVADAMWVIYKHYDPNIPWIPEWVENKLEKVVVAKLAEAAVEAAFKLYKKLKEKN
jgi:hypothetical protein